MRKTRQNTGVCHYLEQCGVLEKGTEEEIMAVRKTYWRKYFREYKIKRRAEKKELTVFLTKDELKKVSGASKYHKVTTARFLKEATMAYIDKVFIVPDKAQLANLEQTLIQINNEIQAIARRNKILFTLNPAEIEKHINRMETVIADALCKPPTIEEDIKNNPPLQAQLRELTNHDCQSQNPQKTEFSAVA